MARKLLFQDLAKNGIRALRHIASTSPLCRSRLSRLFEEPIMTHREEATLYYIQTPGEERPVGQRVEFLPVNIFLAQEDLCKPFWEMVTEQFKTRSKFLSIWPSVSFVAVHRRADELAGFLLVSAPVNWQIDYVTVRPEWRGLGIATALVNEAMNQALARGVPYVMLTSRAGLRPLYEGECGFTVVGTNEAPHSERLMAV
jgi:GNAT superfamily N-acetyltransferase